MRSKASQLIGNFIAVILTLFWIACILLSIVNSLLGNSMLGGYGQRGNEYVFDDYN